MMKKTLTACLLAGMIACSQQAEKEPEAPAIVFEPTFESLSQRELPGWFDDAKLGIFIHWGLYSVPGWAQGTTTPLEEILAHSAGEEWFLQNPYAEWYYNSLRIPGSSTEKHHLATYGKDFSYFDFVSNFNEDIKKFNPDYWADVFKDAGAQYVVLTTKHHDGFLLWPSEHRNPFIENYYASRDLVGELTNSVKKKGMRMGLYYSSGLDWTYNDQPIVDFPTLFTGVPQMPEYAEYIDKHWRELIERYQPSILWADIGSPQAFNEKPLIADFYNQFPDGVVNNRHKFTGMPGEPNPGIWYDYLTPEYQILDSISSKKWETCRGIGLSFGYNQLEDADTFLSVEELVQSFVDIVSKNGNLLLNIGPRADGSIPEGQLVRLQGLGAWLKQNGEGIYGTRPWNRASSQTAEGGRVRFTQKDGNLYAFVLDAPSGNTIVIENMPEAQGKKVTLLAGNRAVESRVENGNLIITLPDGVAVSPAHGFRIN